MHAVEHPEGVHAGPRAIHPVVASVVNRIGVDDNATFPAAPHIGDHDTGTTDTGLPVKLLDIQLSRAWVTASRRYKPTPHRAVLADSFRIGRCGEVVHRGQRHEDGCIVGLKLAVRILIDIGTVQAVVGLIPNARPLEANSNGSKRSEVAIGIGIGITVCVAIGVGIGIGIGISVFEAEAVIRARVDLRIEVATKSHREKCETQDRAFHSELLLALGQEHVLGSFHDGPPDHRDGAPYPSSNVFAISIA